LAVGTHGINEFKIFNAKNEYKPCCSVINLEEGIFAIDYANTSK